MFVGVQEIWTMDQLQNLNSSTYLAAAVTAISGHVCYWKHVVIKIGGNKRETFNKSQWLQNKGIFDIFVLF
jgi:hypothetical protein